MESRKIKKDRYAISDDEIINKHFTNLKHLLIREEKADQECFKTEYLDKKPEDQERQGKSLLFLDLFEVHYSPTGQRLLTFGYGDGRRLPRYALGTGDLVSLAGFETPKLDRPIGTVYDKTDKVIIVAFNLKIPSWVGRDDKYFLYTAESRRPYERMFQAVEETWKARHNQLAYLRNITLGLREPRLLDPIDEKKLSFSNSGLNSEQKQAVQKALEAEDLLIIHGPPGTGKTSVLVEIVAQAVKRQESVLLSAPSNTACDHLVECLDAAGIPVTRLGHPARVTPKVREHTLAYKLWNHPFAKMIDQHEFRIEQLYRQKDRRQDRRVMSWEERKEMREEIRQLKEDIKLLKAQIFQQVWNVSDVLVATHTVCGEPRVKERVFDWVIIDEATQATEPNTWIPICSGKKIILAGDHCQLPPTVRSFQRAGKNLHYTLFERIHDVLPETFKVRLRTQYRMHEHIMRFSSGYFYDNALEAHESAAGRLLRNWLAPEKTYDDFPVIFLDTAGLGYEEKSEEGSSSRYNPEEAGLVLKIFQTLLDKGMPAAEIGVVSPYSAQVKLMTQMIQNQMPENVFAATEIDSIDAFQGREKTVMIVSLVRSNTKGELGFLTDVRRMNVALTRAKSQVIVIGDSATVGSIDFYAQFLAYVERIGGYRSAWELAN